MNELIKKLQESAELAVYGETGWGREEFNQKLVELVVRECMKLNRNTLCEDDPDYLDVVYEEHFGVE